MKSGSEPAASSNNPTKDLSQSKRQEAAFIASEGRELAREQASEGRLNRLAAQQFTLSSRIGEIQRDLTKTIDEVTSDIEKKAAEELEAATKDIDGKVKGLEGSVKNLENDLNKKVLEARNKIIEPLAIFVGLFTFISVGFQIFTQVKEYILWMPILAAVLGGIIIFAGLIIHASSVTADAKERRKYTGLIIGLGAIIFLGAGAYYYKAVEVLRAEDSKHCVTVTTDEPGAAGEKYCKYTR